MHKSTNEDSHGSNSNATRCNCIYKKDIKKKNEEVTSTPDTYISMHQMASLTDRQGIDPDDSVQEQEILSQTTEIMCKCEHMELNPTSVCPRILELEHNHRYDDYYRDLLNAYRERMSFIMLSIVAAFLIYMLILVVVFLLWDYYKQI